MGFTMEDFKEYEKLSDEQRKGMATKPALAEKVEYMKSFLKPGLTRKQIDERLEQIIEFSELGSYIDNPVRTYSSGMYMRLAFAVAINVDADILLVDEVLAVGDQHFQEKCIEKMKELKEQGKTMVFVTHSMQTVKEFCSRAVWLCDGVIKMDGKPDDVIEEYLKETL